MNPRKMQQMMEQMGIDVTDIDAETVTITTTDGEQLVFDAPEVTRMDAQGTQTYQIVGEPDTQDATAVEEGSETDEPAIPEDDIKLVASQAGASADEAREALEAEDGDLAAAISRLK